MEDYRSPTEDMAQGFCSDLYCYLAVSSAGAVSPGFELEGTADSYFRTEDAEVAPA